MVAHIRCATHGVVSLENVHPFCRELWGLQWCFAHNGEVPEFSHQSWGNHVLLGNAQADNLSYHAVGDTDSEAVFCAILNALKAEFHDLPTLPELHGALERLCEEIIDGHDDETIFNFLLSCGENILVAYSWPGRKSGSKVWNGLFYILRQPPFTTAKLVDEDYSIDFSKTNTPDNRIAVITTKPLTNEEGWTELRRGDLLVFANGIPHSTSRDLEKIEQQGFGLTSRCFHKSHMAKVTYKQRCILRSSG